MKPAAFAYQRPDAIAAVLDTLSAGAPDVALLAGGQSLVRLMNARTVRLAVLVDINGVPGLDHLDVTADTVRIGAMVRVGRLERDPSLRARLPVLAEAAALIGHPQIRSRATIGGSLSHADPAAELPTLAVTLGARLRLRSASGERVVPASDFYQAPQATVRRHSELLTEIEIPAPGNLIAQFAEISRRVNDLPLVGVCIAVTVDDGVITSAQVGAGGVGPVPIRLTTAEQMLAGQALADLAPGLPLHGALAATADHVDPSDEPGVPAAFRRGLLRAAIRRAAARLTIAETL